MVLGGFRVSGFQVFFLFFFFGGGCGGGCSGSEGVWRYDGRFELTGRRVGRNHPLWGSLLYC